MNNAEIKAIVQEIKEELRNIKERLAAMEVEQRRIREDLLSGEAKERMQKRILEKHPQRMKQIKKKLDEDIKIKI